MLEVKLNGQRCRVTTDHRQWPKRAGAYMVSPSSGRRLVRVRVKIIRVVVKVRVLTLGLGFVLGLGYLDHYIRVIVGRYVLRLCYG